MRSMMIWSLLLLFLTACTQADSLLRDNDGTEREDSSEATEEEDEADIGSETSPGSYPRSTDGWLDVDFRDTSKQLISPVIQGKPPTYQDKVRARIRENAQKEPKELFSKLKAIASTPIWASHSEVSPEVEAVATYNALQLKLSESARRSPNKIATAVKIGIRTKNLGSTEQKQFEGSAQAEGELGFKGVARVSGEAEYHQMERREIQYGPETEQILFLELTFKDTGTTTVLELTDENVKKEFGRYFAVPKKKLFNRPDFQLVRGRQFTMDWPPKINTGKFDPKRSLYILTKNIREMWCMVAHYCAEWVESGDPVPLEFQKSPNEDMFYLITPEVRTADYYLDSVHPTQVRNLKTKLGQAVKTVAERLAQGKAPLVAVEQWIESGSVQPFSNQILSDLQSAKQKYCLGNALAEVQQLLDIVEQDYLVLDAAHADSAAWLHQLRTKEYLEGNYGLDSVIDTINQHSGKLARFRETACESYSAAIAEHHARQERVRVQGLIDAGTIEANKLAAMVEKVRTSTKRAEVENFAVIEARRLANGFELALESRMYSEGMAWSGQVEAIGLPALETALKNSQIGETVTAALMNAARKTIDEAKARFDADVSEFGLSTMVYDRGMKIDRDLAILHQQLLNLEEDARQKAYLYWLQVLRIHDLKLHSSCYVPGALDLDSCWKISFPLEDDDPRWQELDQKLGRFGESIESLSESLAPTP